MIMAVGVHEVTLSRLEIIPTYAEHVLGTPRTWGTPRTCSSQTI